MVFYVLNVINVINHKKNDDLTKHDSMISLDCCFMIAKLVQITPITVVHDTSKHS